MSQTGIYSENKLVWWIARDGGLPDAPKQVQLILSDLCNQDCVWCAYRMSGYTSNERFVGSSEVASYGHNNPKRWIPTPRALRFLDEFAELGVLSVQFTGGGDPLVHPEAEKIFRHCLDRGLRAALVSNGMKMGPSLIQSVLPKFDWIRISIDASDEKSYSETRRTPVSAWTHVWKNVLMLTDAIAAAKSQTQVGLGFVVTPESYPEIVRFAEIASKAGVGNIRYTAMFSTEDERPFLSVYDQIRSAITQARALYQRDDFIVHDNFGSRFEDLKQHSPDYELCPYQYFTTYVGGDMKAYRCCVNSYSKRGEIAGGDLSERSFAEFWRSEERKKDFETFTATGCPRCQFHSKNRQALYVLGNTASDTVPRHLEWP